MNNIPSKQNEDFQLQLLLAQRLMYSSAKRWSLSQLIIIVFGSIGVTIFAKLAPTMHCYAALCAVVLTLLNEIFISSYILNKKRLAARTQELFDSNVFELPWNTVYAEEKPTPEDIIIYTSSNCISFKELKDWYHPIIGNEDISIARIICQRINIDYDNRLRLNYIKFLLVLVVFTFITCFIIAMWKNMSLVSFLIGLIIPIFPAILFFVRELKDHNKSMNRLKVVTDKVKATWGKILTATNNELLIDSIEIQSAIFLHRVTDPLVPDWLYKKMRSKREINAETLTKCLHQELNDIRQKKYHT